MKTEVYINKIIKETGLTLEEIKIRVEEKKSELKGLISEEGALFIIAKELGIDVKEENRDLLKDIEINISDITPNMKNITLIGRIRDIHRVIEFNKKDGGIGYVGSFLLHDNTGDIRIVLWDDNIKILEDLNFVCNEIVKIINGYAKKGKYNETEIHLGRLGKIILSPEDVDYKKYPKIKGEIISLKDINLNQKSIAIEGKIIQKFPIKEFIRKTGEKGQVSSLIMVDSTGSIRITFWNDDTKKIDNFRTGEFISINNLNPRLSSLDSKTIELVANSTSTVIKKEDKIKIEVELVDSIKNLQNKQNIVSFKGVISTIDNLKKITLKSGEQVPLLAFTVSDDSDGIRVTIWSDKAEAFSKTLSVGVGVLLKNVLVKYNNFSGRNEITFIDGSSLEFVDLEIKNLKNIETQNKAKKSEFTGEYTKIKEINSPGVFELKGFMVKELNNITIYEACSNCFKKIDNCNCNEPNKQSEHKMILNVIVDDESATIRATFIGDKAEKLIGEKTEIILKIRDTPDFDRFLEKRSADLLGKDMIIKGKAKFSDFSNSYELIVYNFQDMDVNDELEKTIKEIEI